MTPEDKLVEAINRNTEAVIKTGDTVLHRPSGERWLVAYSENGYVCACGWPETLARESDCQLIESASEDMRIRLLHEIAGKGGADSRRSYARRALGMAVALLLVFMPAISSHATPLLPPLDQPIIELGTPPAPPPNPHIQYWYTMDVPGPDGVLPVEVFAPRLVAQEASEPQGVKVETPEPGTWISVLIGIPLGWVTYSWMRKRKQRNRAILLDAVRALEPNASTLEIGNLVEGKVPFGLIYIELQAMAEEGILDRRSVAGGPERGGRDRVFYAIKRGGSK